MIFPILCPSCNQSIQNVSSIFDSAFFSIDINDRTIINCPCTQTYILLQSQTDGQYPSYIHIPLSSIGANYDFTQYYYSSNPKLPNSLPDSTFFVLTFFNILKNNLDATSQFYELCPFQYYTNPHSLKSYLDTLLTFS